MSLIIVGWNERYENNRTRELKKLEWVPVPNRMDGSGYTELVDHPNGAAHLGAWLAILEIASRQKQRGTIPHPATEIPQVLARLSRLPAVLFAEVLPRLLKVEWIQQDEEIPQEGAGIPQEGAVPSAHARSIPFSSLRFNSFPEGGEGETDPEFARIVGAFLAAGVVLSEPQVSAAAMEWVSLPDELRPGAADAAEERARKNEARFMGLPASWLRKREWTARGPGRILRAPPGKSELSTEEASKRFEENRGKPRSF